jgi:hypothetical protein
MVEVNFLVPADKVAGLYATVGKFLLDSGEDSYDTPPHSGDRAGRDYWTKREKQLESRKRGTCEELLNDAKRLYSGISPNGQTFLNCLLSAENTTRSVEEAMTAVGFTEPEQLRRSLNTFGRKKYVIERSLPYLKTSGPDGQPLFHMPQPIADLFKGALSRRGEATSE